MNAMVLLTGDAKEVGQYDHTPRVCPRSSSKQREARGMNSPAARIDYRQPIAFDASARTIRCIDSGRKRLHSVIPVFGDEQHTARDADVVRPIELAFPFAFRAERRIELPILRIGSGDVDELQTVIIAIACSLPRYTHMPIGPKN